jgi:hypothetical protein
VAHHGGADASTRAYAAVVYLHGTWTDGTAVTRLLVAKTKVAPVKPVSVPRLELCGALLVARLLRQVASDLECPADRLHATDAKVVLAWIRSHPSRWKPFVANRVAAIQEMLPSERWRFVPTRDNPADAATRDVTPEELATLEPWWQGPSWLAHPPERWPENPVSKEESEERRPLVTLITQGTEANELLVRFSCLHKLIRVTSFCLRFLHNSRSTPRRTGRLSTRELDAARLRWLQIAQRQDFAGEIEALSRGGPLPRRSSLLPLRLILPGTRRIVAGWREAAACTAPPR